MRRLIKRAVAALCTVCFMCTIFSISVFADDAHFTFWNIREEQPDLYVAKTASSAVDGYSVPEDAEFTFTLKWDQDGGGTLEPASNVTYYVYNADGIQVESPDSSDGSFTTTSEGGFSLQAEQYAVFKEAGEVEYEITESKTEDFMQIVPADSEPATGVVDSEGSMVTFENLYIPPGTEEETTRLAIRKDIQWPSEYEMPDFSEITFTFQVTINGSLYGEQDYTVYNADMSQELSTGTTESDGTFTINGGQTVVFEDVKCDVDYKIEEINTKTGWRTVGETSYEGTTEAPILFTYFTNAGASFTVSKERSDGILGDEVFTFILTDNTGNVMSDISYYLYGSDGSLLDSHLSTGENGGFALLTGQTVIFTGIADGQGYQIQEETADHFESLESQNGTMDYNTLAEHTFTNNHLTDITIKKAENNNMNHLLGGAKFTIYSLKEGVEFDSATDDDWIPYPNAEDAVKTTEEDENSNLYGTCCFYDLPFGIYKIEETEAPENYNRSADPVFVTLPCSMTGDEIKAEGIDTDSDDFTGVWSDLDNTYYFYNLTFNITNQHVLMEMPHTGGWGWIYFVLIVVGCMVVGISVYVRNKRNRKEPNAA